LNGRVEMEQKKLLWIIFSATLFLLVVVGAGIIWLYPQPEEQPVASVKESEGKEAGADFDPVEWVRSDKKSPGLKEREDPEEDENFVVVYGEREQPEGSDDAPKDSESESVKIPGPAASDGPSAEEQEKESAPKAPSSTPSTTPSSQKPKEETPAKPAPTRTVRTTEFWIQTGSYTSRTRANKIKAELDRQGFTGRIMSKEVDGTLYYRVRIGPYNEEAEARKFLTWVKEKDQFSKSYISQVYRKKTVAQ